MTIALLEQTATPDLAARFEREFGEPAAFASPEHRAFFDSRAPELVASGWMGAGKSRILCQKAWWVARTYPGVTVALFRKTAASLPATTARTFERDVVDYAFVARRNKSENWWELTNGSRIYFLGLDPDPITGVPSKVGSLDLGWAGVDEAVELTESDWIMLLGRLRDPRMPWHQLAAATNPAHPKHWLRTRILADARRELLTIRANRFLPPEYMAMLSDLPDTAAGRRLGRGEWAAAEGVIWTLPESQIRGPGSQPFKRVIGAIDWGFTHKFACEVMGQTGDGSIKVVDEFYRSGMTLGTKSSDPQTTVIPNLLRLQEAWGISYFVADPSQPEHIATCQGEGLAVQAANNDVDFGLLTVADAIKAGLTVDPSCTGLLGELPGYTFATRKGSLTEKPIEENDDACDAFRYGVVELHRPLWLGASDVAAV